MKVHGGVLVRQGLEGGVGKGTFVPLGLTTFVPLGLTFFLHHEWGTVE